LKTYKPPRCLFSVEHGAAGDPETYGATITEMQWMASAYTVLLAALTITRERSRRLLRSPSRLLDRREIRGA
jgi:hypothetical protein